MGNATDLRAALPASHHPARQALLERFDAMGWPTRKHPAWHYTDLGRLPPSGWQPLPDLGRDIAPAAAEGSDHFALLNAAFAPPAERLSADGHLPGRDVAAGAMDHLQFTASLSEGEQALRVIDDDRRIDGLRTRWGTLALAADSQLDLVWISRGEGTGHDLARLTANVARGAQLRLWVLAMGTATVRLEGDIHLDDEGAQADIHALSLPRQQGALDLPLTLHHHAPHGHSRAWLRAIGLDRTRTSFNGRVVVHEGAVKTDSEQHMASLLLSTKAEINAKPDLEIYNDDVKCAHGASFGQLDDDALFYLRARGLDHDTAHALLTRAFAAEILDTLPDAALRTQVGERMLAQLGEALT